MKKIYAVLIVSLVFYGCGRQAPDQQKAEAEIPKANLGVLIKNSTDALAKGDIPKTINYLNAAVAYYPDNSQAYILLAETYMRLQNFDEAIKTLTQYASINSNDGAIFYLLGYCYGLTGNTAEAIKAAQRSAELFKLTNQEDRFKRSMALAQSLMAAQETETK